MWTTLESRIFYTVPEKQDPNKRLHEEAGSNGGRTENY